MRDLGPGKDASLPGELAQDHAVLIDFLAKSRVNFARFHLYDGVLEAFADFCAWNNDGQEQGLTVIPLEAREIRSDQASFLEHAVATGTTSLKMSFSFFGNAAA